MITVNAGNFSHVGERSGAGASSSLSESDAEAMRQLPGVQYVASGVQMRTQVVAANQNWFTRIQGTDVDLPLIRAYYADAVGKL